MVTIRLAAVPSGAVSGRRAVGVALAAAALWGAGGASAHALEVSGRLLPVPEATPTDAVALAADDGRSFALRPADGVRLPAAPATVRVTGDEVAPGELRVTAVRERRIAPGPGPVHGAAATGAFRTAAILVEWDNARNTTDRTVIAGHFDAPDGIVGYVRTVSGGQASIVRGDGTTPGVQILPGVLSLGATAQTTCGDSLSVATIVAKAKAGGFPVDGFDRVLFVMPDRGAADPCGFAGQAFLRLTGQDPRDPVLRPILLKPQLYHQVQVHELGHTFGAGHANTLSRCGSGAATDPGCERVEYGDQTDPMGVAATFVLENGAYRTSRTPWFSAGNRMRFGWLPPARTTLVRAARSDVRVQRTASASGAELLRVPRSGLYGAYDSRYAEFNGLPTELTVELRRLRLDPLDEWDVAQRPLVAAGALVRVAAAAPSYSQTFVADARPTTDAGTAADPRHVADYTVPAGGTLEDSGGLVSVSTVSVAEDHAIVRVVNRNVPASTSAPVLAGAAVQGAGLDVGVGTWDLPDPVSFVATVLSCAGEDCVVRRATTVAAGTAVPDYVVRAGDVGRRLRVRVVADTGEATSAPALGALSDVVTAAEVAPPTVVDAPVVTGDAIAGRSLATTSGSYGGAEPREVTRRWQRCDADGGACVDVADQAGAAYDLGDADVGRRVRVVETVVNGGGTLESPSAATAVVTAAPPEPPTAGDRPTLSGDARDGGTLTGSGETFGGGAADLTRRWDRCAADGTGCAAVPSATGASRLLGAGDIGRRLRLTVRAENASGAAEVTSDLSSVVQAAAPGVAGVPEITGTARDGSRLTASEATFTGSPATKVRSWLRCTPGCVAVGTGGATYDLTAADIGATMRHRVVAMNDAGTATATSEPTATISALAPTVERDPTITGTPREGEALTAAPASFGGSPSTTTRSWLRCTPECASIADATGATYPLSAADVGATIRHRVVATNDAGQATATSDPTATITAAVAPILAPTVAGVPTITGPARDGAQLTATDATFEGSPSTKVRTWLRCTPECTATGGAGDTYDLTPADIGATIRRRVVATNSAGSATATSEPTATVAAIAPTVRTAPGLTGTAQAGQALTASPPAFDGSPSTVVRGWERCGDAGCSAITGATAVELTLTDADVGRTIVATATATNGAGTVTARSTPSAVVTALPAAPGQGAGGTTDPGTGGTPALGPSAPPPADPGLVPVTPPATDPIAPQGDLGRLTPLPVLAADATRVRVRAPGAGTITVRGVARGRVLLTGRAVRTQAGDATLKLVRTKAGKRVTRRTTVTLTVTFAPRGGGAATKATRRVTLSRRRAAGGRRSA